MKDRVFLHEMSARDGMQVLNRDQKIPIVMRLALLEILQQAGFPYIEVGSFVSPKIMPAMADIEEFVRLIRPYNGQLAALVPTAKYYEKFSVSPNIDTVALFLAASEEYTKKNKNKTIKEDLKDSEKITKAAKGKNYHLRAHLSAAFRDLTEENLPTSEKDVLKMCIQLRDMGCDVISLADTDGRATQDDIKRVLSYVGGKIDLTGIGVHLHDRYGMGLVNAHVAYDIGVRIFDAAVAGIGGNKAVKYSVGNIATDELVNMFNGIGVETGIDLKSLIRAGKLIIEMTKLTNDPPPPSKFLANAIIEEQQIEKVITQENYLEIDIKERIDNSVISFTRVEIPKDNNSPFAIFWCRVPGNKKEVSLGFDLQKRVFIDHLDDDKLDKKVREATIEIDQLLYSFKF